MSLLDKITQAITNRQRQAAESFAKLAGRIIDGDEPTPDEAAEVLRSSDKTIEDLRTEVERQQQRRELRTLIDQEPTLRKRQAALVKQVTAADQALAQAEERHERAVAPLAAELAAIEDQVRQAGDAKRALLRTAPGPIHAELERVRAAAETAIRQRTAAEERLTALSRTVQEIERRRQHRDSDPLFSGKEAAERRAADQHDDDELLRVKRWISEAETEVKKAQNDLDAAHRRTAELTAAAEAD